MTATSPLPTTIAVREATRPKPWTRRQLRRFAYQSTLLAAAAVALLVAAGNVEANLAIRKLSLGFGFLSQEAGFGIPFSVFPYTETDTYLTVFLVGVANTILASALGIVLATILGFSIGIARLSPNWAVAKAALVYVETVRNLPLLLHVLIWYNVAIRALPPVRQARSLLDGVFFSNRGIFVPWLKLSSGWAVPALGVVAAVLAVIVVVRNNRCRLDQTGKAAPVLFPIGAVLGVIGVGLAASGTIGISWPILSGFNFAGGTALSPELAALVLALATYNASFIAELVRGSIAAIDKGQREAAASLGLDRAKTLRLVIVPQALKILIPPLTNQYLHLVKASSLATVIGYPDLVNLFVGTSLNQTGRAIEIMGMTMLVYLSLSLAIMAATNAYHRRSLSRERAAA